MTKTEKDIVRAFYELSCACQKDLSKTETAKNLKIILRDAK